MVDNSTYLQTYHDICVGSGFSHHAAAPRVVIFRNQCLTGKLIIEGKQSPAADIFLSPHLYQVVNLHSF